MPALELAFIIPHPVTSMRPLLSNRTAAAAESAASLLLTAALHKN